MQFHYLLGLLQLQNSVTEIKKITTKINIKGKIQNGVKNTKSRSTCIQSLQLLTTTTTTYFETFKHTCTTLQNYKSASCTKKIHMQSLNCCNNGCFSRCSINCHGNQESCLITVYFVKSPHQCGQSQLEQPQQIFLDKVSEVHLLNKGWYILASFLRLLNYCTIIKSAGLLVLLLPTIITLNTTIKEKEVVIVRSLQSSMLCECHLLYVP